MDIEAQQAEMRLGVRSKSLVKLIRHTPAIELGRTRTKIRNNQLAVTRGSLYLGEVQRMTQMS
jgi:hypothetical protein